MNSPSPPPVSPPSAARLKPRQQRALWILAGVTLLAIAAYFVVNAMRSNLVFFYTPTQIANNEAPRDRMFRIGGLVEMGSVRREAGTVNVRFRVTDTQKGFDVVYTGILPDLFKEGRGIVAQGKMRPDGVFDAKEVLAKHDENYRAPEVQEALKRAGHVEKKSGTGN
jgi:cytochrome c-type biogenesis protein CcmE